MKIALVAIAKDEDAYIDEWVRYYLRIGVDDVFIYQNNWRYCLAADIPSDRVHLIEWDGECRQIPAYNDFIHTQRQGYDFAMFFDVDEFIVVRGGRTLKEFLSGFVDVPMIGVNWRVFGDSGKTDVLDGNHSVIERFIRCQKKLDRHVKTVMNLRLCEDRFPMDNPHYAAGLRWKNAMMDACHRHFLHGPYNFACHGAVDVAYIAHFYCKTFEEFCENKLYKGRADLRPSHELYVRRRHDFDLYNINEVEDHSVQMMWRDGRVDTSCEATGSAWLDMLMELHCRIRDVVSWMGGVVLAGKKLGWGR